MCFIIIGGVPFAHFVGFSNSYFQHPSIMLNPMVFKHIGVSSLICTICRLLYVHVCV